MKKKCCLREERQKRLTARHKVRKRVEICLFSLKVKNK